MLCFAQRCQSAPGFISLPNSSCWTCYLGLAFLLPCPPLWFTQFKALISKIFLDLYSIELKVMQDVMVSQQHKLYGWYMGFSAFGAFFFHSDFLLFPTPGLLSTKYLFALHLWKALTHTCMPYDLPCTHVHQKCQTHLQGLSEIVITAAWALEIANGNAEPCKQEMSSCHHEWQMIMALSRCL